MSNLKNQDLIPGYATHPGEILNDELEARKISQIDFAKQIGLQKSQLNEIINGKRGINADLALLLEKALKIDADYWMNVQKNYELDTAKISRKNQLRLEAITQMQMIEDFVAVKFFKAVGVISGDPIDDIPKIKEIYGVQNFDELASIYANKNYARFKKSEKLQTDKVNLVGWVKLVEYYANQQQITNFDHTKKDDLINELKVAFYKNKNLKNKVTDILKEAGIKLIYQDKYEKTPVDGVSFWSNGNPAIGMTLRHNRVDNFAFTLFHELGHIYMHLPNNNEAKFIDLDKEDPDYKKSKEEKEADEFATNNLIDNKSWQEFFDKHAIHNDKAIKDFSKKVKVHPSIIRGRVCFQKNNYKGKTSISYAIK